MMSIVSRNFVHIFKGAKTMTMISRGRAIARFLGTTAVVAIAAASGVAQAQTPMGPLSSAGDEQHSAEGSPEQPSPEGQHRHDSQVIYFPHEDAQHDDAHQPR